MLHDSAYDALDWRKSSVGKLVHGQTKKKNARVMLRI